MKIERFQQQASVKVQSTDRYGRSVADVQCRGKDAGAEQVRAGMAWVYVKHARGYEHLYPIKQDARSRRRGLWTDAQPVAPWDWRRAGKGTQAPVVADGRTCHTGPKGGRYTVTSSGKKKYGCGAQP